MKRRFNAKKTLCLLLSFVIAVVSFSACSSAENQSSDDMSKGKSNADKVKILLAKESLCLSPVHIAVINGYFDEEFEKAGLEYELVNAETSQAVDLLTAGNIDAAYGLTGSLMQPISNGLAVTFTTGLHTGCTKFYVKADSDIKKLEDLKGKTIGVPSDRKSVV